MKKIALNQLITLLLCLIACIKANADVSGAILVDGIAYTTTGTTGENELLVTSYSSYSGNIKIPAGMNLDGVDYRVVGIGQQAFENTAITSIEIAEGVLTIDYGAFANCTSLTKVTLPSSITTIKQLAFHNCGFSTITLPASLTTLGAKSFSKCANLTNIVIPDNVTQMGTNTFENCPKLTSITVGKGVTIIPNYFANNCTALTQVIINGVVSSIGNNAFYNCDALKSITLPEGLLEIGVTAFSDSGIESIIFPASLEYLGESAFATSNISSATFLGEDTQIEYGAFLRSSIENVSLPANLRVIPDLCFYQCKQLESINLPNSVTTIGKSAFSSSPLTSITLPQNLTTIDNYVFSGCNSLTTVTNSSNKLRSIGEKAFYECKNLTSIDLPTVIFVGNSAFNSCHSLTSAKIPNATHLGASAFAACVSLNEIKLCDNLNRINNYTFYGNSDLTSIDIPSAVTAIEHNAFENCYTLENITGGENIDTIYDKTFYNCTNLIWQLPEGISTIKNSSFEGCKKFESTLPSTLKHIGDKAFTNSKMPSYLIIPDELTHLGSYAFSGCGEIDSISFGSGLKVISPYSFQQLTASMGKIAATNEWYEFNGALKFVKISDNIEEIGEYAFYQCWQIESIEIGDGVTKIGGYSFYDCPRATALTIGKSVTTIGEGAFYNTNAVKYFKKIICKASNPPTCEGAATFGRNGDFNAELIVPVGSKSAYQSAPVWKNFTNITEQNFNAGDVTTGIEDVNNNDNDINININGNTIEVANTYNSIYIYNLCGLPVYQGKASTIELPSGIYILKTNNIVKKIQIK